MAAFFSVLLFIAIGTLAGILGARFFKGTSLVFNIILGLIGSLGFSWLGGWLGLGAGFFALSVWGLIFGTLGACLTVIVYGCLSKRYASAA